LVRTTRSPQKRTSWSHPERAMRILPQNFSGRRTLKRR
jgi:hypothetical protein